MKLRTLQIGWLRCSSQHARRDRAESHSRFHPLLVARESGENLMKAPGESITLRGAGGVVDKLMAVGCIVVPQLVC